MDTSFQSSQRAAGQGWPYVAYACSRVKRARSFYVSDTTGLEDARRAIDATREDWATEVELLRTAARFGGAFLGPGPHPAKGPSFFLCSGVFCFLAG